MPRGPVSGELRNSGYFYRSARDGYGFEADWERLFTTTGGTLDGAVGIGAQNALSSHALGAGRGDTGLKAKQQRVILMFTPVTHV